MRALRTAALAALVVTGLVVMPASAHVTTGPALAATTVVTATRSSVIDVVLRDDALISPRGEANPDVRIAGAGRVVGFYLYRTDGTDDSVLGMRLPRSSGGRTVTFVQPGVAARCKGVPSDDVPLTEDCGSAPAPRFARLHQGYYRLVVLTDGAPVRLTLTLHGLRGSTSITPRKPVASRQQRMSVLPDPTGHVARAVTTIAPPRRALAVDVVTAKWAGKGDIYGGSACWYSGSDAVAQQMLPGCPGGISGRWTFVDPRHEMSPSGTHGSLGFALVDGGELTGGQELDDSSGVAITDGTAAWIALP